MMIAKPKELPLPILDRKLPPSWKNIIQYTSVKYRSIPNSKWFVDHAIIFDKRGFSLILFDKEGNYDFTVNENLTKDLTIIDYLNGNFNYANQYGQKVTAEVVMLKEDALPPLDELRQKLDAGLRIPLVAYVQNQMLSEDELPKFNGKKTTAPRRRAPAKKCPIKVDFRRMI